jgi:hypothetical protein
MRLMVELCLMRRSAREAEDNYCVLGTNLEYMGKVVLRDPLRTMPCAGRKDPRHIPRLFKRKAASPVGDPSPRHDRRDPTGALYDHDLVQGPTDSSTHLSPKFGSSYTANSARYRHSSPTSLTAAAAASFNPQSNLQANASDLPLPGKLGISKLHDHLISSVGWE